MEESIHLELDGVGLQRQGVTLLHGISLTVPAGALVAVLGANGAGKSRLLRAIAGLEPGVVGHVRLYRPGQAPLALAGRAPADIVHAGVVLCPQGRHLFAGMSVRANLSTGSWVHRRDRAGNRERFDALMARFPDLAARLHQAAGTLSGGQQQALAIARALMGRPQVLLLDEPSAGLAPLWVQDLWQLIADIRAQGTTVLLAEQHVHATLQRATHACLMVQGRLVHSAPAAQWQVDESLRRVYLGA